MQNSYNKRSMEKETYYEELPAILAQISNFRMRTIASNTLYEGLPVIHFPILECE